MGISRGPNIVKEGLILHFDAASRRSYTSGSDIWRNLTDIDSPISGNMVGLSWTGSAIGSVYFDGTENYVDCGLNIFNTSSYTKIIAFKPHQADANNLISGDTHQNYGLHTLWMNSTSDTIKAGHNALSYNTIQYNAGNMLHKWNWVAQTFDSSTGFQLYYNGNLVASSSDTTPILSGSGCYIGAYKHTTYNDFNGVIGIAMIYNRVLTDDEMAQNYEAVKRRFGL